jgi:5-methylcytosine-specific restriction endonuclease McrA
MAKGALPKPDSDELMQIVRGSKERAVYGVLHENQDRAVTMREVRETLGLDAGEQEHLNRRMRELYKFFDIERTRQGRESLYRLRGRLATPQVATGRISKTDRAWVLRDQRCAQCGRTPTEDHVKLHVDHKIPQEWGGDDERENLQALCSECNEGKRHFYATYNKYANEIRQAVDHDEPHRRIGELLKAFKGAPVRNEVIERVASAKQYQEDWQKRLRELRVLGWKITPKKRKENDRIVSYYQLDHWERWPQGKIADEIRRRERARGAQR